MARAAKAAGNHAADAIDKQLARYRSMRDFHVTAEPNGKEPPSGKQRSAALKERSLPFVIQKHAASHLHYDFRLGWNGVLKSWAVAKGPSYVPRDKRLAVQVEDHPMEYGGFEGIIPQGQYGGGTVMVWDQGAWSPHGDVDEGLKKGSLKFELHGKKMKGNWTLVRMGGKAAKERKPNWLLIKEHDKFERAPEAESITEEMPNSAVTGRSLEEIAAQKDHVWESKKAGKSWHRSSSPASAPEKSQAKSRSFVTELRGLPKESQPKFLPPQLAMTATAPTNSSDWLHELKLDGYRIQAHISGKSREAKLLTRTGLDWTHRMRAVAHALPALPVESAVLDGEVVVVAADGTTSFADLQAAFQDGAKKPLTYFVFDLLHLNGHDLRGLDLLRRKKILEKIMEGAAEAGGLRISEHIVAHGETLFEKACALHAEGIISKRVTGKYVSGRSSDWLKVKCIREQEFVIGGFTQPGNGSHGIGALLLGYYEGGKLIYAGRTGTGFTQKLHRLLRERLASLAVKESPFQNLPAEAKRGAHWVKPQLVGQIRFATWTADDLLRQASFKGLREDKPAKEVRREKIMADQEEKLPKRSSTKVPTTSTKKFAASTKNAAVPQVRLTHPEKILDAGSGLTKQALADYYWAVAAHMLPHIADRPLSLVRCPEGSGKPCFYQKHKNHMLPPGVESVDVPDKKTGKPEEYITLSTPEALAGLAQMGVLEVHPWGSQNDDLEHPDRIVIDLDPDPAIPWKTLAAAALDAKKRFQQLGLESFLKTTGGKGLHVVVPIKPEHPWPVIKQFTHDFVLAMEKAQPHLYLTKMTKSARKGKIYLDYLRNDRGSTSVAPYSPRARAGAHVSMPLAWAELKGNKLPQFSVPAFSAWKKRLAKGPWTKMPGIRQKLPKL
jgi:bifunctional non-homologous end joining protein LigD